MGEAHVLEYVLEKDVSMGNVTSVEMIENVEELTTEFVMLDNVEQENAAQMEIVLGIKIVVEASAILDHHLLLVLLIHHVLVHKHVLLEGVHLANKKNLLLLENTNIHFTFAELFTN